ncbi:zinc finger protein 761-like [Oppia nitens]|uniref:zinc finger protein 761-like n=1 Tax=Oppia nitens TaxID=1686743 RepID=UPI0023DB29C3|nr:zinc finger protein 761-like [Oppia nitens]
MQSLCDLSRYQLYSMVNALRREVQCLANNLMRYQLFAEKYRKLLNELQTIDEISVEFDEDLRQMRQQLMSLSDDNDCEVVIDEDINHDMNSRYLDKECQTTTRHTITGDNHHQKKQRFVKTEKNRNREVEKDYEAVVVDCDDVKYGSAGDHNNNNTNVRYSLRSDIQRKSVKTTVNLPVKRQQITTIVHKFRCDWKGCIKVYNSQYVLNKHRLTHRGFKYRCPNQDCDKSFGNYSYFRCHVNHHKNTLRCPREGCQYQTGLKQRLESHMKSHITDTPFRCLLNGCDKQCKTDDLLREHRLRRHPDCLVDVSWIECPESGCDFRTKSHTSMAGHTASHTKRHVCLECDKRYATAKQLKACKLRHRLHTGEGQEEEDIANNIAGVSSVKYRCDWPGCDKEYLAEYTLKKHRLMHEGHTYQCTHEGCGKSYKEYTYFRNHLSHHKNTHQCPHEGCSYSSGLKSRIESHLKSHVTETPFKCMLSGCEQVFKTDDQMQAHQLRRHPEQFPDVPWIECGHNGCDVRSKSALKITEHRNIHIRAHECPVCGKHFGTAYLVRKHQKSTHGSSETLDGQCEKYRCDWPGCAKEYKHPNVLERHKLAHTGFTYQCTHEGCGKSFKDYTYFRSHVNHHKATYRCLHSGCSYTTGLKKRLETHQRSHDTETPYKCCVGCAQVFKTETQMTLHHLRRHPDNFPDVPWIGCEFPGCDFRAKSPAVLAQHRLWHTKPYRCVDCDKQFSSSKEIKRHRMTQHNADRIPCEWYGCERQFSTRADMLDHMNVHTAQLSYRCEWPGCDKSYVTKRTLKSHVYKVHTKKSKQLTVTMVTTNDGYAVV